MQLDVDLVECEHLTVPVPAKKTPEISESGDTAVFGRHLKVSGGIEGVRCTDDRWWKILGDAKAPASCEGLH